MATLLDSVRVQMVRDKILKGHLLKVIAGNGMRCAWVLFFTSPSGQVPCSRLSIAPKR